VEFRSTVGRDRRTEDFIGLYLSPTAPVNWTTSNDIPRRSTNGKRLSSSNCLSHGPAKDAPTARTETLLLFTFLSSLARWQCKTKEWWPFRSLSSVYAAVIYSREVIANHVMYECVCVCAGLCACIYVLIKANKKLSCRREAARWFVSLDISRSHWGSLKVIRHDTIEWGMCNSLIVFHCNYHTCIKYSRSKCKCKY